MQAFKKNNIKVEIQLNRAIVYVCALRSQIKMHARIVLALMMNRRQPYIQGTTRPSPRCKVPVAFLFNKLLLSSCKNLPCLSEVILHGILMMLNLLQGYFMQHFQRR